MGNEGEGCDFFSFFLIFFLDEGGRAKKRRKTKRFSQRRKDMVIYHILFLFTLFLAVLVEEGVFIIPKVLQKLLQIMFW